MPNPAKTLQSDIRTQCTCALTSPLLIESSCDLHFNCEAMAMRAEIESLGTEEICDLLAQRVQDIDPETIATFRRNKINGKAFISLTVICESSCRLLVSERTYKESLGPFNPKL